jgi:hypothetical protein
MIVCTAKAVKRSMPAIALSDARTFSARGKPARRDVDD